MSDIRVEEYYRRFDPEPIVCPHLEKKLGRKALIYQPRYGLWENGEFKFPYFPVGDSCMWRRHFDKLDNFDPETQIHVVLEYGSTRDDRGWTRQMVMYEYGTPSPYPFTHDMFTEENEKMQRDIDSKYSI